MEVGGNLGVGASVEAGDVVGGRRYSAEARLVFGSEHPPGKNPLVVGDDKGELVPIKVSPEPTL